jgi:8-hydroxy-5-deazaflavin:NADPH oxidoreductase
VILAIKGSAAESVVSSLASKLKNKTVIDTTNPISDNPPKNGVLSYFTGSDESLMERLQKLSPEAHFVKAFNSVGKAFMVDPSFSDGSPTMFICGNNDDAKKNVTGLLVDVGWDVADMGQVESARAIEPLCILWCIPGFLENKWSHAFKLLKK